MKATVTNGNADKGSYNLVISIATSMKASFSKHRNDNSLGIEKMAQNRVRKRHEVKTVCIQNKLNRGKIRCLRSLGICKHQEDITFQLILRQSSHIK